MKKRDTRTVKGLIDEYIESYAKPKKMSWHEDLRVLNKDVLPKWKYLPTTDITEKDVVKLLGRVGTANKTLKVLQSMFAFAVSQNILEASPCSNLDAPEDEILKDRIFTEDEIRKIWFGLENAKMSEGMRLILKLLLLTGQRNGEVAGARWEEFNLRQKWWTIPGTRTKNKKNHQVFLTPMTLDILQPAKKHGCVFPSGKDKHIAPRAVNMAIRNNCQSNHEFAYGDFFKVGQFVPNDLRRTAASLMAKSGVGEACIAIVLNHAPSAKNHDPEIRQALEVWEQKLQTILLGEGKPDHSK